MMLSDLLPCWVLMAAGGTPIGAPGRRGTDARDLHLFAAIRSRETACSCGLWQDGHHV
jgi:hypothetical protein